MQKVNRVDIYNVITPDQAKMARKTFSGEMENIKKNKNFISQVTERNFAAGAKKTSGKKLAISRIESYQKHIETVNTLSEVISDRLNKGEKFDKAFTNFVNSQRTLKEDNNVVLL